MAMAARPIGPWSQYWQCRIQGADAYRAGRLITACPYDEDRQFSGRAWRDGWRAAAVAAGVKLPHQLASVPKGNQTMIKFSLLAVAGVLEALVVHHMGHTGERSRGDSRIIDWPDATWKLVREDPENENSPRYFSAYGRDVGQPESLLAFDPETRRLTLHGGNRKDAANERLSKPLLDLLRAHPDGMSGRQLDEAMVDAWHGRNASREARAYAGRRGSCSRALVRRTRSFRTSTQIHPSVRQCATVRR